MVRKPTYGELSQEVDRLKQENRELRKAEAVLREREKRFSEEALNSLPAVFHLYDEHGDLVRWNKNCEKLTGYSSEELSGFTVLDWFGESDRDLVAGNFQRIIAADDTHAMASLDVDLTMKNGSKVPYRFSVVQMTDSGKAYALVLGFDTTEQRADQDALRRSEEKYRILFEKANIAISVAQDGRIIYPNPMLLKLHGYSREELTSRPFTDFIHPDDREMVQRRHEKRLRGEGPPDIYSYRILTKSGETRRVELNVVPISWEGRPAALCFVIDVTDRSDVEEALRRNEELFRIVFQTSPDSICISDQDGYYIDVNRGFTEEIGYTREESIGRRSQDLNLWVDNSDLEEMRRVLFDKGRIRNFETRFRRKDGSCTRSLLSAVSFEMDGRDHSLSVTREISDLKEAETALRESEKQYRLLADNSVDVIWTMDRAQNLTYVSPSVEQLRGYTVEEVMAETFEEGYLPSYLERALSAIREAEGSGEPVVFEAEQPCKDGSTVWSELSIQKLIDDSGSRIGLIGTSRNITERKRVEEDKGELERRLQQAQKMEAIGALAGGVAHDFNNILAAIFGYLELMQMELPAEHPSHEKLDQLLKAAERARDLVQQILLFSRQGDTETRRVQPHLVIKEALKLLRSSIPTTVDIQQDIPADCGSVLADPTQLHQIIMNLCTNAYHAMREEGGTLKVGLCRIDVDKDDVSYTSLDLDPRSYIRMTVADTGHGMDPEIRERIFNPYFTTKPKGEGTGLGLSVVHGIVKNAEGHIRVHSEPGEGTEVSVYFPTLDVENRASVESPEPAVPTGDQRILVVDDELLILDAMRQITEGLGYEVVIHSDSQEALTTFEADPGSFDLVITDMTMPHMTGLDLTRRLLAVRPEVPIILCTGFSEMMTEGKAHALGIRKFVKKPILIREIAEAIREALDADS